MLDTGIGLTVLSESLAGRVGVVADRGTFTGRRMSGQEVRVPLAACPELSLGAFARTDHVVGLLDTSGFPPTLGGVDGFLSLAFFEETPFTVDYAQRAVVVETAESLRERAKAGVVVPVRLERDGPSLCAFLALAVPGVGTIEVEVDTGSDCLILDARIAPRMGVDLDGPKVRRVEGRDETGNEYTRTFARLRTTVHAAEAASVSQREPEVMFQRIVHDGLVGDAYLRRFVVTYDLPASRMLLA